MASRIVMPLLGAIKDDRLPPLKPHLRKERFVFFFEYCRIVLPLKSLCIAPHHYMLSQTKYLIEVDSLLLCCINRVEQKENFDFVQGDSQYCGQLIAIGQRLTGNVDEDIKNTASCHPSRSQTTQLD